MNIENELIKLKKSGDAPEFLEDFSYQTLSKGYLQNGETPKQMYKRVAKAAASYYPEEDLESEFFNILWKGYLGAATPVLCNMGTDNLPISCFGSYIEDSTLNIFEKATEIALLSKYGGGTSAYLGDIRPRGAIISTGGISNGVVSWAKLYDTTISTVSQGNNRRGNMALYLPIEHPDIEEFLDIRLPVGDLNTRCLNIHHGVTITNSWMEDLLDGKEYNRLIWKKICEVRAKSGEPYIVFSDNINSNNPQIYKDLKLSVRASNLCSEISLYSDVDHTFVCCLSSLNLSKWDEWKNTNTVELSIKFLDAVMQEFINKASKIKGLEPAVNFAIKNRALGLGVMGFHTLLQSKNIPFDSFESFTLNNLIFKTIREKADLSTKQLAEKYGEPVWCKGYGVRNTHLLAIAPTTSNALICGGISQSIEPLTANIFVQKSAKGTFIRKNPALENLLREKGRNTEDVWKSITGFHGSVQHLKFLTDHEKEVFKTAREINQFAIIKLAAQRQKYIDQAQSLNLFFTSNVDPKYFNQVHIEAWKLGLKSLYYCRTESVLKGQIASGTVSFSENDCKACEG